MKTFVFLTLRVLTFFKVMGQNAPRNFIFRQNQSKKGLAEFTVRKASNFISIQFEVNLGNQISLIIPGGYTASSLGGQIDV